MGGYVAPLIQYRQVMPALFPEKTLHLRAGAGAEVLEQFRPYLRLLARGRRESLPSSPATVRITLTSRPRDAPPKKRPSAARQIEPHSVYQDRGRP